MSPSHNFNDHRESIWHGSDNTHRLVQYQHNTGVSLPLTYHRPKSMWNGTENVPAECLVLINSTEMSVNGSRERSCWGEDGYRQYDIGREFLRSLFPPFYRPRWTTKGAWRYKIQRESNGGHHNRSFLFNERTTVSETGNNTPFLFQNFKTTTKSFHSTNAI